MAGTVIVGSGGGHRAMRYLSTKFSSMTAEQQAKAVELVRAFVEDVNAEFDQDISTHEL